MNLEISKLNKKKFKVHEVMLEVGQFPIAKTTDFLKDSIELMDNYRLGIICVIDEQNKLSGILTDGDLRRNLSNVQKPLASYFLDYTTKYIKRDATTIYENDSLNEALEIMEKKEIWDLPVLNENNELTGLLHLHKAIKKILTNNIH